MKFDETGDKITASRFIIQTVNITNGNVEIDMVRELRRICKQSSLNVTVFHPYFLFFDQVSDSELVITNNSKITVACTYIAGDKKIHHAVDRLQSQLLSSEININY